MPHFDFVYVTSYNECDERLIRGLQSEFANLGCSFAVVGYTSSYVEKLHEKLGVTFFNLRSPGPLRPVHSDEWSRIEERLNTTLAEFIFPEKRYYLSPTARLIARTKAILEGFDALLDQISIGCMLHKLGAEIIRRASHLIADQRDIKTLMLGTFPAHLKGRMYLHGQFWSERDKEGAPDPNTADEVSFQEFADTLQRIKNRSEVIHYPLPGGRGVGEAFSFIRAMIRHSEFEFVYDIVRRRLETVRFRLRNAIGNLFAGSALPDEPYYFFPLHVFDDSQITVRNPEFFDQAWVIEYLDRVLPAGMVLVVKLHPGLDGAVPMAFLRAVSKLRRVRLLRGSVNAHQVIARSEGVIVINSTVAFEALLHRKPVLVLGRWSFGRIGLTSHIDDWRDLPQALKALRQRHVDPQHVDRTLYDLYGEMHRCSYNREPIEYGELAAAMLEYVEAAA